MRFLLIFLAAAFFFAPLPARAQQVLTPSWGGTVSFNFDDGNKNIYQNALPIFKKYRMVASIFPIVGAIDNREDWIVTWPQLLEFKKAGWEIGSHTMTHPYLPALSDADLDYELGNSKKILAKHGIDAKTLAFPYNICDSRVLDYTSRYYENSRLTGELNGIDIDRYAFVCKDVSAATAPEEVIAWINEAVQKKMWLVLMLHEIVPGTPNDYQYNAADLEKIVAHLAANNIQALTVRQAMARRQATLGPNLMKNPKLENLDGSGWALNWRRNDMTQVAVEPAAVKRMFSSGQRLKIMGNSRQNMANPAIIRLPDNKRPYLFSFFTELATAGENGGVGFCVDEFDATGNWLNYQWFGGLYWHTCGMPGYLYQPSSPLVDRVMISIYADPNADVTFRGDNFYFGVIN